jgi:hypothetical protein
MYAYQHFFCLFYRRIFVDKKLGVRRVKDVVEVEPESSVVAQESCFNLLLSYAHCY